MEPLIQGLLRAEAYDHPVDRIEVRQTHISWVILTGPFAYKIKKPVDFGFLNFTTLDRRRACCEDEVRLNRRLAPDLYLGVRPIFGPVDRPSLAEGTIPIEFAVQMRQFPQESLLPVALDGGTLEARHIDNLARVLATFHAGAAIDAGGTWGDPESIHRQMEDNFPPLERLLENNAASICDELNESLAELRNWVERQFPLLAEIFHRRQRTRRVRECHGDLHLGNMILRDDSVEMFDCLEFAPSLRWIDVVSEMAFLAMDLTERGRADFAFRILNGWLEQTGDYAGMATWQWYFVHRALVRAKVTALRLAQEELTKPEQSSLRSDVRNYVALARSQISAPPGPLVITHGVSGSGKSFLSQRLLENLGAVRLRSDVERKRLFGLWGQPRERVRTGHPYQKEVSEELYGDLLPSLACEVISAGLPLIVDATFLMHRHRVTFRNLAQRRGIPFVILEFPTSLEQVRVRIAERRSRGGDPSDADWEVLESQIRNDEPLSPEERVWSIQISDAASDLQVICNKIRQRRS